MSSASGIEIVANAVARRRGPVAGPAEISNLIALKVLARRSQDLTDLDALLAAADETDIAVAREAVALVSARGFHRDQDVAADLEQVIAASQI